MTVGLPDAPLQLGVPQDNDLLPPYCTHDCVQSSYVTIVENHTVGFLDHSTWKTEFFRGKAVIGEGASTREFTEHAWVTSNSTPLLGIFSDPYAYARAVRTYEGSPAPPERWVEWNSWANSLNHEDITADLIIRASDALPAGSSIVRDAVYNLNDSETIRWIKHVKSRSQHAGLYMSPCVVYRPACGYDTNDILLRDRNGSPIRAWFSKSKIRDVTHPSFPCYIRKQFQDARALGYTHVKLDFLNYGALEGAHYVPSTGMQAYAHMLRVIANYSQGFRVAFSMSLPFPSGSMPHSRRMSMDQPFGYMRVTMNALKGGAWLRELHTLDPDSVTVNHTGGMHASARLLKPMLVGGICKYGDPWVSTPTIPVRSNWGLLWDTNIWTNGTHYIVLNYSYEPVDSPCGTVGAKEGILCKHTV